MQELNKEVFVSIDPNTLLNGTTADATQVQVKFDAIFSGIDMTNCDATSICGVTTVQTLTNKTLTAPILNGSITGTYTLAGTPTLSGTFAGTPTFSGAITFSAGIGVASGQKVLLDGVAGNDYLENTSNGVNILVAAGNTVFSTTSSGQISFQADASIPTATAFFLKGLGSGDYLINNGTGINKLFANGTAALTTTSAQQINFGNDIGVPSTSGIFLDTISGDDFWQNTSQGVNVLKAAGVAALTTNSSGEIKLVGGITTPTANYFNQNSGVKSWGSFLNNGTITTLSAYNSSISRTSAGSVRVTFTTPFSSSAYVVTATCGNVNIIVTATINNASTVDITTTKRSDGTVQDADCQFMAIGAQ